MDSYGIPKESYGFLRIPRFYRCYKVVIGSHKFVACWKQHKLTVVHCLSVSIVGARMAHSALVRPGLY
jgi:hypothetical protein